MTRFRWARRGQCFPGLDTCGLSLVEVVVAMAVVTVALLPLMSMLPTQSIAEARAEQLTTSTILAQGKLEELRTAFNANFQAPLAAGGIVAGGQASGDFAASGYPKHRYTMTATIAQQDVLYLLRVTTWYDADRNGQVDAGERAVKLVTQVARRRW